MALLKKETLADQAAGEIARRIIGGELAAGERLTEEGLGRELGISRTPLRDALRRLEAEGLVEALPHRGCRVREWSAEGVRDLFEARSRLEAMMLELSLPAIPRRLLREWRETLAASPACPEPEKRRVSREVDEAMHQAVAGFCPNRTLGELLAQMLRRTAPFRNYRTATLPAVDQLTAERLELIDAMLANETERAQRLLAEHVRQGSGVVAG